MNPTLQIFLIVISCTATLCSGLVLWNLTTLKERIAAVELKQDKYLAQRVDCQQSFVSAEQFVRSESYNRQKLDAISDSVSSLAGNLKIVEQMPAICGQIAREIVREMKDAKG